MKALKKIKEKVASLKGRHDRKTGPMAPKAGVGTHNRYCGGGKLKKK